MIRHIFIFLGTFVAGAAIALAARAALFKPHADPTGHPAPRGDYAPMVSNALTPAKDTAPTVVPPIPAAVAEAPAASPHDAHGHEAAPAAKVAAASATVNSVCAICGMPVDPKLPVLEYQGKKIGFGCKMCVPKFKADPDKYGPAYLRNEILK